MTDAEKQDKLIKGYLKALSKQSNAKNRGQGTEQTNHSVLVSLGYLNSITSTPNSKERLSNLCFFYQLASWHLQCKNPNTLYGRSKGQEIKDLGENYYKTYKHFYRISNDTNFRGVSLRLLPYLEYLFRTRINVFVVESLDETKDDDNPGSARKRKKSLKERYTPVLKCVYSCDKTIEVVYIYSVGSSRDVRKKDVTAGNDVMVTATRLGDRNRGRWCAGQTVRREMGNVK